jgi:hypothetical protein
VGLLASCGGSPFTASSSSNGGGAGTSGASSPEGGKGGRASAPDPAAGGDATTDLPAAGSAVGGASQTPDPGDGEMGGAGGAAGAGGRADAACPSAVDSGYQVGFFPELRTASSQEIHPFFELQTTTAPVALERLSLRYYFSKEVEAVETGSCFWVTGDRCANVRLSWHDVVPPTPSANRYLELRFDGAQSNLTSLEPVEVRVGFFAAQKLMLQSNDYSFDERALAPTTTEKFPYKPWPRVTLYLDDVLVWGSEPCL